ncbi:MAG: protein kinase [Myxococcota bacterium]
MSLAALEEAERARAVGRNGAARATLDACTPFADAGPEVRRLVLSADLALVEGDLPSARRHAQDAEQLALASGVEIPRARLVLATLSTYAGAYAQARKALDAVLESDDAPEAVRRGARCLHVAHLQLVGAQHLAVRTARELLETTSDPMARVQVTLSVWQSLWEAGSASEAAQALEDALDTARGSESTVLCVPILCRLALLALAAGDLEGARARLQALLPHREHPPGFREVEADRIHLLVEALAQDTLPPLNPTKAPHLNRVDAEMFEALEAFQGGDMEGAVERLAGATARTHPVLFVRQRWHALYCLLLARSARWDALGEALGTESVPTIEPYTGRWLEQVAGLARAAGRPALAARAASTAIGAYRLQGNPAAERLLAMDLPARGAPVGPFELDALLGAGGMGVVWSATHASSGRRYALKMVKGPATTGPMRASFEREIAALAALQHPAIVPIVDAGWLEELPARALGLPAGAPWLAQPLVDGGDLSGWTAPRTFEDVRTVLAQLLDALGHAHARGVLHLDVKAPNVLVQGRGPRRQVMLADFGLAQYVASLQARRAGTPHVMAPEQWRGDVRRLGPWTDLYAVGCLSVQLLTGSTPFRGFDLAVLERAHRTDPRPVLEPLGAPPGFDAWLHRMLAVEPYDRYSRAADARAALLGLPASSTVFEPTATASDTTGLAWAPAVQAVAVPSVTGAGTRLAPLRRPPLQGRTAELAALDAVLEASVHGPSRIALVGPPGVGRTELARTIAEQAHATRGWTSWTLRTDHYPAAAPAITGLLRELVFGAVRSESEVPARSTRSPPRCSTPCRSDRTLRPRSPQRPTDASPSRASCWAGAWSRAPCSPSGARTTCPRACPCQRIAPRSPVRGSACTRARGSRWPCSRRSPRRGPRTMSPRGRPSLPGSTRSCCRRWSATVSCGRTIAGGPSLRPCTTR